MIQFVLEFATDSEIEKFYEKYGDEQFILPLDARILSGIMLSISIKQGYLIEEIIRDIVAQERHLELHSVSGEMRTRLLYTKHSVSAVERYLSRMAQQKNEPKGRVYRALLERIRRNEADETKPLIESGNYNIDVMFRDNRDGKMYQIEIKFADTHNKYAYQTIHRKLFIIYAGLLNTMENSKWESLTPMLYYFNPFRIMRNRYLPGRYILRGSTFFEKFFTMVTYSDILEIFKKVKGGKDMRDAIGGLQEYVQKYVEKRRRDGMVLSDVGTSD